jgi:sulfur-carrier protein adenylyltransferase/sulfurtransferase
MGCLQATECLKILLGRPPEEIASGRVLVFDALKMKFGEMGLAKRPNRETVTELIDYKGFCAGPKGDPTPQKATHSSNEASDVGTAVSKTRSMDEVDEVGGGSTDSFHSIQPKECLHRLSTGWTPWVLDVRLQTENDIVALPFTDEVAPHRTVGVHHVPKSGDVLVYCKGGVRGVKACNRLIELGIEPDRLFNLDGGIMRWQKDVDPTMPRY